MADMNEVPEEHREELVARLIAEVSDMTIRELAMLLLEAMDIEEVRARVQEIETGEEIAEVVYQ